MPESRSTRTKRPSLEPRPHVTRHRIDWEDVPNLTLRIIAVLGPQIHRGCHYVNPLYTVSSPEPTAAFYRKAIWARDGWGHLFSKTIDRRGFRDLSRELSTTNRRLQISGVMFVDGTDVPPHRWKAMADFAINPDLSQITSSHRPVDLAHFDSSEGVQFLASKSRAELQRHLSTHPSAALYVTPALTLFAPRLTTTFLTEAHEAENQWHRRSHRHLDGQRKQLARSVDLTTKMLVFQGTLAAEGQIYLPGCWPDQTITESKLRATPFQGRTVPPTFLGLYLPVHEVAEDEAPDRVVPPLATVSRPPVTGS